MTHPTPTREEVERWITWLDGVGPHSLHGDMPVGTARLLRALLAAKEQAEAERDNWKAHAVSRGKRLRKARDEFIGIREELCDEGDRVYFGSTNHADAFKDSVEWLDDFAWDKIMGEPEDWNMQAAIDRLSAERDALRKERDELEKRAEDYWGEIECLAYGKTVPAQKLDAALAQVAGLEESDAFACSILSTLAEHDLDEQIADNGMTVLDGLKNQAVDWFGRRKRRRAALASTEEKKDV